jgi:chromosome segregation ATPase
VLPVSSHRGGARPPRARAEPPPHAADREKRALAAQLKASRDARRRGQLEQRIQKLNLQLADAKRRIEHEGKSRVRLDPLRGSIKRELEQLDQATKRLDEELERLGKEEERLEERVEQIDEQREVQQGRLKELAKAELTLKKAARK